MDQIVHRAVHGFLHLGVHELLKKYHHRHGARSHAAAAQAEAEEVAIMDMISIHVEFDRKTPTFMGLFESVEHVVDDFIIYVQKNHGKMMVGRIDEPEAEGMVTSIREIAEYSEVWCGIDEDLSNLIGEQHKRIVPGIETSLINLVLNAAAKLGRFDLVFTPLSPWSLRRCEYSKTWGVSIPTGQQAPWHIETGSGVTCVNAKIQAWSRLGKQIMYLQ